MRWLVVAWFVVGCGRVGFDATSRVDGDSAAITSQQLGPLTFSTTSTELIDIPDATLTIPPSIGTRWLLLVSGTLVSTSGTYDAPVARYLVDGVERGIGGTEAFNGNAGPWQHLYVTDGTDAAQTVTFQLRDTFGATTTLGDLRAVLVPFAPDALVYANADAPITVDSMMPMTVASLTLTPEIAGDHIVLLSQNTTEAPTASNIFSYWMGPGGAMWTLEQQVSRGALQSSLMVRRANLTGPTTIGLTAYSSSIATAMYLRAAALRVDALPGIFEVTQQAPMGTGDGSALAAHTVSVPPGPDGHHVVLATARLDDDCGGGIAVRETDFVVDGVSHPSRFEPGNCAYETFGGVAELHSTRPSNLEVRVSTGNAPQPVTYRESSFVVLPVP